MKHFASKTTMTTRIRIFFNPQLRFTERVKRFNVFEGANVAQRVVDNRIVPDSAESDAVLS